MMNPTPRENTSEGKKPNNLEFMQRIDDLMTVIQQKNMEITALQHNYELASRLIKVENSKSLEWSDKIAAMERENSSLRNEKQALEAKKNKIQKDLEKSQEEVKKLYASVDEYRSSRLKDQSNKSKLEKKVTVT